jgi:hypothetical protein
MESWAVVSVFMSRFTSRLMVIVCWVKGIPGGRVQLEQVWNGFHRQCSGNARSRQKNAPEMTKDRGTGMALYAARLEGRRGTSPPQLLSPHSIRMKYFTAKMQNETQEDLCYVRLGFEGQHWVDWASSRRPAETQNAKAGHSLHRSWHWPR